MRTAYVFAGQGAQYVGMGVQIAEHYPQAKALYDRASAVLGFDLLKMCQVGPEELLQQTENAQPAILVTSLACLLAVQPKLPQPIVMAGLSLGEYSALVAAGALEFEEAVYIVQQRGIFMKEATADQDVGMAAILGLDAAQVEALCQQTATLGLCQVTNYNAPTQTVVGGHITAVARVVELAKQAGATAAVPLAVSGAFHTRLMQPAAEHLAELLATVKLRNTVFPVISNVTAQHMCGTGEIRQLLIQQIQNPVRWVQSIQRLASDGIDTFIEFGPGHTLSSLIKRTVKGVQTLNVENSTSMDKTLEAVTEEWH
ncbi:ACP S-malonyltransferase [Nostoc favosum]|uniref:Malonyl CoA-acyl carrier protein transacylase n=1 Tax=Nostoc favosum CHAB5714 TaxID=2780399 RepID=A0ABS8IMW3_9NOSO|nr:ACP S-malonyltransferase [Nostoc favosum]MCC5605076.1 ACP S-malonyltransferase [Nostoc favosum CHAB5714]